MNLKITMVDDFTRILENQFGVFEQRKIKRKTGRRTQQGKPTWRTVKSILIVQPPKRRKTAG